MSRRSGDIRPVLNIQAHRPVVSRAVVGLLNGDMRISSRLRAGHFLILSQNLELLRGSANSSTPVLFDDLKQLTMVRCVHNQQAGQP